MVLIERGGVVRMKEEWEAEGGGQRRKISWEGRENGDGRENQAANERHEDEERYEANSRSSESLAFSVITLT